MRNRARYRWMIKDLSKVHPTTRKYLTAATPRPFDFMREAAEHVMERKPGSYVAIALYSGHHLLGWAMLDFWLSNGSRLVRTYVFVKPRLRRNGYGTMLIATARKVAKRRGRGIRVLPYNKTSRCFFRAVNIKKSEVGPGYWL